MPGVLSHGLNIVFIGDSNTEIGHVTGELARRFEKEYGYHGSGYRSLNTVVGMGAGYLPHLKIENSGAWQPYVMVPYNKDAPAPYLSPDGTAVVGSTPGLQTRVEFIGEAVDLYWLAQPEGGEFTVEVDGAKKQTIETTAAKLEVRRVRLEGLKLGAHVLKATVQSGRVTLLGVDTRAGDTRTGQTAKRAVVHKWGRGYATTDNFLAIEPNVFASGLKLLQPDIVIILLGTNDHNITGTGPRSYAANIQQLVKRVQAALPTTKVLVVSTAGVGVGRSRQLHNEYLKVLPVIAAQSGAHYWDLAEYFGPSEEHKNWMLDALHFNAAGGEKIAEKLSAVIGDLAQKPAPEYSEKFTTRGAAQPKIEGLQRPPRMWLSASAEMVLDGEGRVANWRDSSGTPTRRLTPAEAAQPVAAWRPQWVENAINGQPAVRFDGKITFLFADFLDNGASNYTFVLRAKNADGALLGHSNAAIASPDLLRGFAGDLWINGRQQNAETPLPLNQPLIVSVAPKGVTPMFLLGLQQSANNEGVLSRYFEGAIAEVMVFYPEPDDAQRRVVEEFLSRKYNIALSAAGTSAPVP